MIAENVFKKRIIVSGDICVKRENIFTFTEKQLGSSIKDLETNSENSFIFDKENNNKRVIVVDNEQDILFTYRAFLKDYDYCSRNKRDSYRRVPLIQTSYPNHCQ